MSEQNDNELDKAFRSGIERMHLVPPPTVWDGVRANALQQQLFRYQTVNNWLRFLTAGLGLALVGSLVFVANKKEILPTVQTVYVTKTDTVFITKTEKIYVPTFTPNSVNNHQNEASNSEQLANNNLSQNVDNQEVNENFDKNNYKKNELNYPINANEEKVKSSSNLAKNERVAKGNFANEKSILDKNSGVKSPTNTVENKVKNTNKFTQKLADEPVLEGVKSYGKMVDIAPNSGETAKEKPENIAKTNNKFTQKPSDEPTLEGVKSYGNMVDIAPNSGETPNENAGIFFGKANKLAINTLNTKDFKENILAKNLPEIDFIPRTVIRNPSRILKGASPIWSKLSLSSYISPDFTSLVQNFTLANDPLNQGQASHATYSFGVRAGLNITPKLTVLVGVENALSQFKREEIEVWNPQMFGGRPLTNQKPFGTDKDGGKPAERIILQENINTSLSLTRIPILAKYDFYQSKQTAYGSSQHTLKLYAVAGGYWNLAMTKQVQTNISEPNGKQTQLLSSDFPSVQPNSWGINLGLGVEYQVWKRWNLYFEPTFKRDISPIMKDPRVQTYLSGVSLAGGIKFQFGK